MPLLEMRAAAFARSRSLLAGPVDATLEAQERLALRFETPREAAIVAMLAAAVAKATSGRVHVGEFDPRIQPVHAKRLVGYVPYEAVPHEFDSFEQYIAYRATLWDVDRQEAIARAYGVREHLDGVHEAFAYPLIGALLPKPTYIVLDRPQAAYAAQIFAVAGSAGVFSTHTSEREARAFTAEPAATLA